MHSQIHSQCNIQWKIVRVAAESAIHIFIILISSGSHYREHLRKLVTYFLSEKQFILWQFYLILNILFLIDVAKDPE